MFSQRVCVRMYESNLDIIDAHRAQKTACCVEISAKVKVLLVLGKCIW
jgi:hypothetical protein